MNYDEDAKYLIPLSLGDHEAFEFLYAKYRLPLMIFTLRYVRSEAAARDIVQDVFLSVWNCRKRFSTVKLFHSYVYCAAKNIAVDHLRAIAVRQRYSMNVAVRHGEWMVEEQYHAYETACIIQALVLNMPPQRSRVYVMSRTVGLNRKEIARELHLSEKTVAKHLYLAMKKIRQTIDTA